MEFVSVRVISSDVERLAAFWEQVTGLPAIRPVPVFAELRTPAGLARRPGPCRDNRAARTRQDDLHPGSPLRLRTAR